MHMYTFSNAKVFSNNFITPPHTEVQDAGDHGHAGSPNSHPEAPVKQRVEGHDLCHDFCLHIQMTLGPEYTHSHSQQQNWKHNTVISNTVWSQSSRIHWNGSSLLRFKSKITPPVLRRCKLVTWSTVKMLLLQVPLMYVVTNVNH